MSKVPDQTPEERADGFIEAMASSGLVDTNRPIEVIREARERIVRIFEQTDRFPEDLVETFGSMEWIAAYLVEVGRDPEQELFTLIRITSVPDGGAPLEIREQWVGTVLPAFSSEPCPVAAGDVTDISSEESCEPGYIVESNLAASTLRNDGKSEAADWWENMYISQGRRIGGELLVFDDDYAEPITPENALD